MITVLNMGMIVLLFWVFYEDLKDRQITLLCVLTLIGIGGFLNYSMQIPEIFLLNSVMNMSTLVVVMSLLALYAKFRFKASLFKVLGTGDALFFLFLAISFPTTTFLVVFSCSLIFSLLISVLFKRKLTKWVPLAGLQALFLGVLMGVNQVFGVINLYTV